jgi:uroporphyrinogen-III decarboxylase
MRYFWWKHYLQGNFDPSRLLFHPVIKKMVHEMIDEFGKDKYIVNLGHGILPNILLITPKHLSMQ